MRRPIHRPHERDVGASSLYVFRIEICRNVPGLHFSLYMPRRIESLASCKRLVKYIFSMAYFARPIEELQ